MDDLRRLADLIVNPTEDQPGEGLRYRRGVVQSVQTNTYTIRLGGSTTDLAGVPSMVPLMAGDVVTVLMAGSTPVVLNHDDTGWRVVGASGQPGWLNGWNNASGSGSVAAFRKVNGRIYLRGQVNGGGVGTAMWNMPVGFRPYALSRWATNTYNGSEVYGAVSVATDGNVFLLVGGTLGWVSLDPVSYVPAG